MKQLIQGQKIDHFFHHSRRPHDHSQERSYKEKSRLFQGITRLEILSRPKAPKILKELLSRSEKLENSEEFQMLK